MAQNKHIREQRALRESLYLRLEDIATVEGFLSNRTRKSYLRELPVQFRSSAQSPVADKTSIVQTSKTRLPKLNLQTFDAKLENWSAFIQVFNRSIHDNNTLANVERFEYLLGCLSGEPLNLIKTIVLSDDNYPIAYKTLLDRYDNKRELATHYWDRLRSLQKLKDETPSGLRSLIYNFNENLSALRAIKIADSLEDFMLLNILLEKLDSKTRRYFEAEIRNLKVCEKDHIIYRCPVLKAKSPADRFKVVKEKRLCINCLRPHQVKNCSSTSTCRTCHKNHHTLLHFDRFSGSSGAINETSDSGNTAPAEIVVPTVNALASSLSRQVALLSTALVDVHDSQGHPHTLRVLIDNGSEASFITIKAARNLNLKRQHDKIQIQGIGANSSIFSSGSIHCKISPHGSCQPAIHLEAHIIPHVASVIPSQSLQFLLVGSKLQQDIVEILLRFRSHSVVFITDIKQMYRQIQVAPQYWDYQHDSSPPLHWRVGRVLEIHPGSDNIVRVVTLKTALGTLKRPVRITLVKPFNNPRWCSPHLLETIRLFAATRQINIFENQQAVFPYLLKTPRDRKYGTQGHPGHRKSYSP
ncbi:hypothetical protein NQ318_018022 [Aromia moschata]|uniref:DUF5641 domain-containing protein n=1 Tax=Aromia moschata TaxID=1265417 RepID=A0AAV8ZFB3_9CUCU|nr:hypothetical protein NQ318_018022 [Aromia moschata]